MLRGRGPSRRPRRSGPRTPWPPFCAEEGTLVSHTTPHITRASRLSDRNAPCRAHRRAAPLAGGLLAAAQRRHRAHVRLVRERHLQPLADLRQRLPARGPRLSRRTPPALTPPCNPPCDNQTWKDTETEENCPRHGPPGADLPRHPKRRRCLLAPGRPLALVPGTLGCHGLCRRLCRLRGYGFDGAAATLGSQPPSPAPPPLPAWRPRLCRCCCRPWTCQPPSPPPSPSG